MTDIYGFLLCFSCSFEICLYSGRILVKFLLEVLSSEKLFFGHILNFRSDQRSGCINLVGAVREMTNHEKPLRARHGLVHIDT